MAEEKISGRQARGLKIAMAVVLCASMFFVAREGARYVTSTQVEEKREFCVVIDAGHGSGN